MKHDKIVIAMRAFIFTMSIVGCAIASFSIVLDLAPFFFGACSFLIFMFCGLVATSDV